MASNAVLPPPTITYPAGAFSSVASSPTGTQRAPSATSNGGRIGRRHTRRHVRRVDDVASNGHVRHLIRHPGAEAPVAQVVAHREEADPPRRQEPVTHDLVEVAADLRAAGPLVEVGVRAVALDPVLSEWSRVDAVVPRRLVELHERVRVQPMAARVDGAARPSRRRRRCARSTCRRTPSRARRHRRRDSRSRVPSQKTSGTNVCSSIGART